MPDPMRPSPRTVMCRMLRSCREPLERQAISGNRAITEVSSTSIRLRFRDRRGEVPVNDAVRRGSAIELAAVVVAGDGEHRLLSGRAVRVLLVEHVRAGRLPLQLVADP